MSGVSMNTSVPSESFPLEKEQETLSKLETENIKQKLESLPLEESTSKYSELRNRFIKALDRKDVESLKSIIEEVDTYLKTTQKIQEVNKEARDFKEECGKVCNKTKSNKADLLDSLSSNASTYQAAVFRYLKTIDSYHAHTQQPKQNCEMLYHTPGLFKKKVVVCPECKKSVCESCSTDTPMLKNIRLCHGCFHSFVVSYQSIPTDPNFEFFKKQYYMKIDHLKTMKQMEQTCITLLSNLQKCQIIMEKSKELLEAAKDFEQKCTSLKNKFCYVVVDTKDDANATDTILTGGAFTLGSALVQTDTFWTSLASATNRLTALTGRAYELGQAAKVVAPYLSKVLFVTGGLMTAAGGAEYTANQIREKTKQWVLNIANDLIKDFYPIEIKI